MGMLLLTNAETYERTVDKCMAGEGTEKLQTKTRTRCHTERLYRSVVWLSDLQTVDASFIFISKYFGHALAAVLVRSDMWDLSVSILERKQFTALPAAVSGLPT